MDKVLIVGSNGMLGSACIRLSASYQTIEFIGLDYPDIDVSNIDSLKTSIIKHRPTIVFNCSAYTNVEACEDELEYPKALSVNELGIKNLAELCRDNGIKLVHISTDYVFSSDDPSGYDETRTPDKNLNRYGQSKFLGEQAMVHAYGGLDGSNFRLQNPNAYLIRTSWLFGRGAKNFVSKIIDMAKNTGQLKVVDDEIGRPTLVDNLATAMLDLCQNVYPSGIYHITGSGLCSRYDFAKEILDGLNIPVQITRAKLTDFPRKAKVPNISLLNNTKYPLLRDWKEMVDEYSRAG